jgi:hypothetical protein
MGNSNELKGIVSLKLMRLDMSKMKAIRSPGQWAHDALPTVGSKLSVLKMAGS